MFLNSLTLGLFLIVNCIGVNSLFKLNNCKRSDPQNTDCYFDHDHQADQYEDLQTVDICFKPKLSFNKILVYDYRVDEKAHSFEIDDLFKFEAWNLLTITTVVRKGKMHDSIQYTFNDKSYPVLYIPKNSKKFEFNIGMTFKGEFEGKLNDLGPCTRSSPRSLGDEVPLNSSKHDDPFIHPSKHDDPFIHPSVDSTSTGSKQDDQLGPSYSTSIGSNPECGLLLSFIYLTIAIMLTRVAYDF